jgi:hypothetical protein
MSNKLSPTKDTQRATPMTTPQREKRHHEDPNYTPTKKLRFQQTDGNERAAGYQLMQQAKTFTWSEGQLVSSNEILQQQGKTDGNKIGLQTPGIPLRPCFTHGGQNKSGFCYNLSLVAAFSSIMPESIEWASGQPFFDLVFLARKSKLIEWNPCWWLGLGISWYRGLTPFVPMGIRSHRPEEPVYHIVPIFDLDGVGTIPQFLLSFLFLWSESDYPDRWTEGLFQDHSFLSNQGDGAVAWLKRDKSSLGKARFSTE